MTDQDVLIIFGAFSAIVTMTVCILFIVIGIVGGSISIRIGGSSDDDVHKPTDKPTDPGSSHPC